MKDYMESQENNNLKGILKLNDQEEIEEFRKQWIRAIINSAKARDPKTGRYIKILKGPIGNIGHKGELGPPGR